MDFNDTPEELAFRHECREWLAANAEPKRLDRASAIAHLPLEEALARARDGQGRKADAGFACIHWPREHGGRGLTLMHSIVYSQEEDHFDVPKGFFEITLGICAPPLIAYGSEEDRRRFLPRMVRGDDVWCQLFSEPVAGSDLAGLRTRAVRDGDEWVVNGQKVWNSGAHYAERAILVTRHDPSLPKHKGLTFFHLDMKAPGVEVKPIHQISGASNFNEVFLTNVRIPDSQRLGEVGEGWQVSITTLMSERLSSTPRPPDFDHIFDLARTLEIDGRPAVADSAIRQRLADWYVESEGLRLTNARLLTAISQGRKPGPEASIQKLVAVNKQQAIASFGADLMEMGGSLTHPDQAGAGGLFQDGYLSSPGGRIAAGTDEILRNIIAERVLGLPGDIRVDRDSAFSEIPSGEA